MEELLIRITVILSGSRDERSKVASHVPFHPTLFCRSSAGERRMTWTLLRRVFLHRHRFRLIALSLLAVITVAVFQTFLSDSEQAASDLESGLRTWEAAGFSGEKPDVIPVSFERISKSCTACHQQFRDVPLKEKARKL